VTFSPVSLRREHVVATESINFLFVIHSETYWIEKAIPIIVSANPWLRSSLFFHNSIFNICNVSIEWEDVVTFSNETYVVFAALEAKSLGICDH